MCVQESCFNFFTPLFKVRPEVKVSGARNLIREGDAVTLTCKITQGQPRPQITWFKNNSSKGHNMSLSFNKITKEDAGLYTCEAKNRGGIFAENMVFLTNESANKAEIDILSARDTTRPGP